MTADENFLSRWSRLKKRALTEPAQEAPPAAEAPQQMRPVPAPEEPPTQPAQPQPLPPVESLTLESDFTPFMNADVDPALRRSALKTLFQDPRFNVMDRLDVYIDDYSKPDPLPEGWLEKMNQVARLGAYVEPAEEEPQAPLSEPEVAEPGPAAALPEPAEPIVAGDEPPAPEPGNCEIK